MENKAFEGDTGPTQIQVAEYNPHSGSPTAVEDDQKPSSSGSSDSQSGEGSGRGSPLPEKVDPTAVDTMPKTPLNGKVYPEGDSVVIMKEEPYEVPDKPYAGMGKEDLLRFSQTPFWNRFRMACTVCLSTKLYICSSSSHITFPIANG